MQELNLPRIVINMKQKDQSIIRPLAERYSELAQLDIQKERLERYKKTIALEKVRPVVLIDEVPWGEFEADELRLRCSDPGYRGIERFLRRSLFQWENFQADMVIPPRFSVRKRIKSTGFGIDVQETRLAGNTGTDIVSHEYTDQLKTEEDLKKIRIPQITYDREGTEREMETAEEIFRGLLPVKLSGIQVYYSIWDEISTLRGVDNLLIDLSLRPEFMKQTVEKFARIFESLIDQYEELDLLDPEPILLHRTPAATDDLPAPDFSGKVRRKDVWGRCHAQIFSAVSPDMHDEFDLVYNSELFRDFGLVYYGCCEPLDRKIPLLRKRFDNLRKISITPWADPERAAAEIGSDYVLAGKPNPAFVNSPVFDPKPVEEELKRYLEACKRHGTTCEFVLKDISTVARNPRNLTEWAETAKRMIDRYY